MSLYNFALHVCMVNITLKYNFVELLFHKRIISTDESFAMINLRGVSTKIYFNMMIIFFKL